jgi:hypothetical protein
MKTAAADLIACPHEAARGGVARIARTALAPTIIQRMAAVTARARISVMMALQQLKETRVETEDREAVHLEPLDSRYHQLA